MEWPPRELLEIWDRSGFYGCIQTPGIEGFLFPGQNYFSWIRLCSILTDLLPWKIPPCAFYSQIFRQLTVQIPRKPNEFPNETWKKTNEKSKPELRNSQIHLSSFPGISSQQVLLRKTGILSQLEFPWRKTELSQLLLLDFLWNFPGKQQNSQGSRAHFPWISPLKQNFGSSFFPTFPS